MYRRTEALILASGSPRRKELLHGIGIDADIVPADIDEGALAYTEPKPYVEELARQKAAAVAEQFPDTAVLAADTIVLYDNMVLGKPEDDADAIRMLSMLSGKTHHVWGGIALITPNGATVDASCTTVHFRALSDSLIRGYVASGETTDKAGAYAMQAKGACFVSTIEGSHTNVIGLDLVRTIALLSEYSLITVAE